MNSLTVWQKTAKWATICFIRFYIVTYLSQFNFYFIKLFNSLYWTRYILLIWANDLWSFWKVWIFEKRDIIHSIRGQTNKGLKVRSSFWHMSDHWKFSVVTFFNVQPIYFYRMLHYFPWFFYLILNILICLIIFG